MSLTKYDEYVIVPFEQKSTFKDLYKVLTP